MHARGFGQCKHPGPNWASALARALHCLGLSMSRAEEYSAVESFEQSEPVWHRGILLTGEDR